MTATKLKTDEKKPNPEFTIRREFDAPRDPVWKSWTDSEHMARWWGPKGFKVRVSKMDFRVGGTYHYCIVSPEGMDMWGKFTYRNIAAPERVSFVSCFSNEKGGITRHPMNPTWPVEMLTTVTFSEDSGKTTVSVKWEPINGTEAELKTFVEGMASMNQGWSGTFDQFAAYLKTL